MEEEKKRVAEEAEEKEEPYRISHDEKYYYWQNWTVLIWLPNLVGYVRIGLLIASWHYATIEPYLFIICYSASYLLDMLDGFLARICNQNSSFGAQLDMVTDRVTSASMFLILMRLTVKKCEDAERVYWVTFFGLMFIFDFVAHFFHVNSNYAWGHSSHKDQKDTILWMYYWKPCLAFTVGMAEYFFVYLYMTFFPEDFAPLLAHEYVTYAFYLSIAVGVVFKTATNYLHLVNALYDISEMTIAEQEFDEAYARGEVDSYGEEIEEEQEEEEEEIIGSPSKRRVD